MGKEHAGIKREYYNPGEPSYEALTIIETYRVAKKRVELFPNGEYVMTVSFYNLETAKGFIKMFKDVFKMKS